MTRRIEPERGRRVKDKHGFESAGAVGGNPPIQQKSNKPSTSKYLSLHNVTQSDPLFSPTPPDEDLRPTAVQPLLYTVRFQVFGRQGQNPLPDTDSPPRPAPQSHRTVLSQARRLALLRAAARRRQPFFLPDTELRAGKAAVPGERSCWRGALMPERGTAFQQNYWGKTGERAKPRHRYCGVSR